MYLGRFLRLQVAMVIVACIVTATCLVDDQRFITRGICTANYGELLMPSFLTRTRLTCVMHCATITECQSLVYDPSTGECWINKFRMVFPTAGCNLTHLYADDQQLGATGCVTNHKYPSMRLCDGSGTHEGRLEVNYQGLWGTVCDDRISFQSSWDNRNADVVCRMFGYQFGTPRVGAYFGQGQGNILMDDIQCNGTEVSVFDCLRNPWGINDCQHIEDLGVTCSTNTWS